MKSTLVKNLWLCLLLLFIALPPLLNGALNEPLRERPTILVIGDFSESDSFGSAIYTGVDRARTNDAGSHRPLIIPIKITESATPGRPSTTLDEVRRRLLREIARNNVVAIIAANTSQTAQPVLEVGRSVKVPVLLTVATNDRLIDGYEGTAFRLPAYDTLQAKAIAEWAQNHKRDGAVAVFYDPRQYGSDLQQSLSRAIGPLNLVTFPIGNGDMGTCLDIGRRLHVSLWIVLGYREQAMEFLARKSRLAIPGIVLLSDGAYGEWLRDIQISDLYLSFPRVRPKDSPTTIPDRSRQLRGYASYGFDAYLIILKALDEAIARNGDKTTFKALLSESSLAPNLVPLAGSYDFAASGENNAATFTIVEVGNGNLP